VNDAQPLVPERCVELAVGATLPGARGQGASAVADARTNLENLREAGFYGTKALMTNAAAAPQLLGDIRTWALS